MILYINAIYIWCIQPDDFPKITYEHGTVTHRICAQLKKTMQRN